MSRKETEGPATRTFVETLGAWVVAGGSGKAAVRERVARVIRERLNTDGVVVGHLDLRYCTGNQLPDNLHVGGDLWLQDCTGLTQLPDNLHVGGSLNLHRCTGLTQLSDNLHVGGMLDLRDCTGLTQLPDNLHVGGSLLLLDCTGLTQLPDNLRVGGRLGLVRCTGLTQLPDNLHVGRSLDLSRCTGLTQLPDNLHVGGRLDLVRCTGLSQLPDNLHVDGSLDLGGCTGLTQLPNWITTLGPLSDGSPRNVHLENTGLSAEVLGRLRETEAPGMRFCFTMPSERQDVVFASLEQVYRAWMGEGQLPRVPAAQAGQGGELRRFLTRLRNTPEFKNPSTRDSLVGRVRQFLTQIQEPDVWTVAAGEISYALTSCIDNVMVGLDTIEIALLAQAAETGALTEEGLRALAKKFMAYDIVKRHFVAKASTLMFVDHIEVLLAYTTKLHELLPTDTQNMRFRGISGVTEADIQLARTEIQNAIADPAQVDAYLATWSPWQRLLRQKEAHQLPAWDALPMFKGEIPDGEVCPITLAPVGELDEPVAITDEAEHPSFFEYEGFRAYFAKYGAVNPSNRKELDLKTLCRLTRLHRSSSLTG